MTFGELKEVDLREAWPHEASDFTPWLAKNLERLSNDIDMRLELEDTEVAVEQFSADILARNLDDDSRVLIENQYGATDHRHLGQILTYLAGLEAHTIIWIAQRFEDAHLSAIRWLNEHTFEPFAFLAVQLKVLQIADSPLVPQFQVLERPSNWDRQIREVQRSRSTNPIGQFRREFWEFYVNRYPGDIARASATSNQWVHIEEANLNISLALVQDKVGLFVRGFRGEDHEEARERITAYEAAFRDQFPNWPTDEPIYDCAEWMNSNSRDPEDWPRMADWLHQHLNIYRTILTGCD